MPAVSQELPLVNKMGKLRLRTSKVTELVCGGVWIETCLLVFGLSEVSIAKGGRGYREGRKTPDDPTTGLSREKSSVQGWEGNRLFLVSISCNWTLVLGFPTLDWCMCAHPDHRPRSQQRPLWQLLLCHYSTQTVDESGWGMCDIEHLQKEIPRVSNLWPLSHI